VIKQYYLAFNKSFPDTLDALLQNRPLPSATPPPRPAAPKQPTPQAPKTPASPSKPKTPAQLPLETELLAKFGSAQAELQAQFKAMFPSLTDAEIASTLAESETADDAAVLLAVRKLTS